MPVFFLEVRSDYVAAAADTGDADRRLAVVSLQPCDQFLQIVRRQRRFADEPHWAVRHQRDRLEVLHHVERQRSKSGAVDHMRLPVAKDQRVAVGRRASDARRADGARGAGRVLDDDGLTEQSFQALAKDARQRVGRPASGERHDDGDRPRRIGLRRSRYIPCSPREWQTSLLSVFVIPIPLFNSPLPP